MSASPRPPRLRGLAAGSLAALASAAVAAWAQVPPPPAGSVAMEPATPWSK